MTTTTTEPGYRHYVVNDGTVTDYAAGTFIAICSGDGRIERYAVTSGTRIDAARLTSAQVSLRLGQKVNLTARLDGEVATATTIRLG